MTSTKTTPNHGTCTRSTFSTMGNRLNWGLKRFLIRKSIPS